MTLINIEPSQVQMGDTVVLNKQTYSVNSMQGPDSHGAYDAYLQNANGAVHKVVTEPITIIV